MLRSRVAAIAFIVTFISVIEVSASTSDCGEHSEVYKRYIQRLMTSANVKSAVQANRTPEWTSKMFDASGHWPSGIRFRIQEWSGSFSRCLKIQTTYDNSTEVAFRGQYCTANLKLSLNGITRLDGDVEFVPIQYGICWPSSCTAHQIQEQLIDTLQILSVNFTDVTVDPLSCYTDEPKPYDAPAILAIALYATFGFLLVSATLIDAFHTFPVKTSQSKGIRVLMAFSGIRNTRKIFDMTPNADDFGALHGIRLLSAIWVVVGHLIYGILFPSSMLLIENAEDILDYLRSNSITILMNFIKAVDTFLFLSAFLMTRGFMKRMKHMNGNYSISEYALQCARRYWRLTIPMMMLITFHAGLLHRMSNGGPPWNQIVGHEADTCRKNWWIHVLSVQNVYDTRNRCAEHTWSLAMDMQFYVVAPIILYPLYKFPKLGVSLLASIFLGSIITTAAMIYYIDTLGFISENLLNTEASTCIKFDDNVYTAPWSRLASYLVGIALAYILHCKEMKIKLHWAWVAIGWFSSVAMLIASNIGNRDLITGDYIMSREERTWYGALDGTLHTIAIAWITFACITGYGGFVNTALSWKALLPLSRLAFSTYLVHYYILFSYFASFEVAVQLNAPFIMMAFIGIYVTSNFVGFIFALLFEFPITELGKMIFAETKRIKSKAS